jgi:hypothetical protein
MFTWRSTAKDHKTRNIMAHPLESSFESNLAKVFMPGMPAIYQILTGKAEMVLKDDGICEE